MKVIRALLLATCAVVGTQSLADANLQLNNGLSVSDSSTNAYLKINGRLQLDYVNASRDSETLVNDAKVHRAWLTISGARDDWFFLHRFDLDPEPNGSELSSFIEYRGFGPMVYVGVGRHKEPFGMRWRTSINHTATPERSAISDGHTLGRSVGVLVRGYGDSVGYEAGIFEDESAENPSEEESVNNGAFTGRIFTPITISDNQRMHLGLGTSQRSKKDVYNLEFAYINNRFHVQTEWFQTKWSETFVSNSETEDGFTVDLGWFLTQDSMPYKNGAFKKVTPSAEKGAWQIIARFDQGVGNFSDIQLTRGEGQQITVGVNWFANANTRLAMSYSRGEIDETLVNGVEVNSELINQTGEEIRARLQFVF